MRDAALIGVVLALMVLSVLDYAASVEERLARLERRPAVIIGGKWSEPSGRRTED